MHWTGDIALLFEPLRELAAHNSDQSLQSVMREGVPELVTAEYDNWNGGTTYYSLVGLHATHVVVGLILLTVVFLFGLAGRVGPEQTKRTEVLSLYWHFVDGVWVVVFTVVYILGR